MLHLSTLRLLFPICSQVSQQQSVLSPSPTRKLMRSKSIILSKMYPTISNEEIGTAVPTIVDKIDEVINFVMKYDISTDTTEETKQKTADDTADMNQVDSYIDSSVGKYKTRINQSITNNGTQYLKLEFFTFMQQFEKEMDEPIPVEVIVDCFEFYMRASDHFIDPSNHIVEMYKTRTEFEIGDYICYDNREYEIARLHSKKIKLYIINTTNTNDHKWINIPNPNIHPPSQIFDKVRISGLVKQSSDREKMNMNLENLSSAFAEFGVDPKDLGLPKRISPSSSSYSQTPLSYKKMLNISKDGWNTGKRIFRLQLVKDNKFETEHYHRIGLCTNNNISNTVKLYNIFMNDHNGELGDVFYWDRYDKKIKINLNNQKKTIEFDTYQGWTKYDTISIVIDMTNKNVHKLEFCCNDYPVCNAMNITIPQDMKITYYPIYEIFDDPKKVKYEMIHRKSQQKLKPITNANEQSMDIQTTTMN